MDTQAPQIHYTVRGPIKQQETTDTYIFVHGNRGSSIYWEQVIDLFHSRRDVRTVSLDLRGYGKSNHITELNSMEDFADDVHGVAMKVAKDAGMAEEEISARFVVVGWSFGGMVVITLASKYPAYYSRLVLVASGPIGGMKIGREVTKQELFATPYVANAEEALQKKDIDFFRKFAEETWFAITQKPANIDALLNECLLQTNFPTSAWLVVNFNRLEQVKEHFPKDCQVLIYHCKDDSVVPFKFAEENAAVLGHNCKLIAVEKVGHMIPLIIPEKFVQDVIRFYDLE